MSQTLRGILLSFNSMLIYIRAKLEVIKCPPTKRKTSNKVMSINNVNPIEISARNLKKNWFSYA